CDCCSQTGARSDTIPILEILCRDVKATHSTSVAPVDPDRVFYLESRGHPTSSAVRMIGRGSSPMFWSTLRSPRCATSSTRRSPGGGTARTSPGDRATSPRFPNCRSPGPRPTPNGGSTPRCVSRAAAQPHRGRSPFARGTRLSDRADHL
ncbi:SUF system FeS cluster assembly, SufBD, partial [mine drainage metagenome]